MYIGGVPVAKHHSVFPGIAETTESLSVNVGAAKRQIKKRRTVYTYSKKYEEPSSRSTR